MLRRKYKWRQCTAAAPAKRLRLRAQDILENGCSKFRYLRVHWNVHTCTAATHTANGLSILQIYAPSIHDFIFFHSKGTVNRSVPLCLHTRDIVNRINGYGIASLPIRNGILNLKKDDIRVL